MRNVTFGTTSGKSDSTSGGISGDIMSHNLCGKILKVT